jgi:outer membrane autotransporter protein
LNFDSKRYLTDTGGTATGSRNGDQIFASLTSGYEYRQGGLLLSPYGRLNGSRSNLDPFTETGGGWPDLRYGSQTVDTLTGFLGLRVKYEMPTDWGSIAPKARVEYGHDFSGNSKVALSYADQSAGQTYNLSTSGTGSNYLNLDLGADMKIGDEWTIGFDYGASLGQSDGSVPQQVHVKIGARV